MANRKQPLEPVNSPMTPRVVVQMRLARAGVAIDLFANAALRWLCRGHAPSPLRLVAGSR
jgi:hypothetical protein